jgi:hypothetical protein
MNKKNYYSRFSVLLQWRKYGAICNFVSSIVQYTIIVHTVHVLKDTVEFVSEVHGILAFEKFFPVNISRQRTANEGPAAVQYKCLI